MKKIQIFLLCGLLCAVSSCTPTIDKGEMGTTKWKITGSENNYTLTISGTGSVETCWTLQLMTLFEGKDAKPLWCDYSDDITAVVIAKGITSIDTNAFMGCHNVTTITIPSSVISMGTFLLSNALTAIIVDENNPNYSSVDGVLFNKDKTTLIQYPPKKAGTSYAVPNTVTSIGKNAFFGCENLLSITIPNSVKDIGEKAFVNCGNLLAIEVAKDNPIFSSVDGVLFSERSLIKYPAQKEDLRYTIPNSVQFINEDAFTLNQKLMSVTIPESVIYIGKMAFMSCTGLISLNFDNDNDRLEHIVIDEKAFAFCTDLGIVSIPYKSIVADDAFPNSRYVHRRLK